MKILLTSLGLGAVEDFLTPAITIGFIPTAGDIYENPSFIDNDRKQLVNFGFRLLEIDIHRLSPQGIAQHFEKAEALFIAGGNTFYLMQEIMRKGADELIRNYIASNRAYIGASAGAVICGPNLEPVKTFDDPAAAPLLNDMNGLNIINFVPLPHYGKPKYLDQYHQIMQTYQTKWPMVPIKDDEAIRVSNSNDYEIIASA